MAQASNATGAIELETKTFSVAKLLDAIRTGRMRIPRFQRGFRWSDEDRRLLFDSLQAGYPIGTLLLARGEAPADRVTLGGYSIDVPATSDALWVVDGQQRLSTLATALLEDHSGAYRSIYFDLEAERFEIGARRRAPPPHWAPVHMLSSSSILNKWLREQAMSDRISDRADEISRRIREYTIPAYLVPYDGRNDALLKQIFARINRRGRALESHEVFQALHASVLGAKGPIDRVRDDLAQLGFGSIDPRQVERAALAVAGGDPGGSLERDVPEADVPALFDRVSKSLAAAIDFLANDAGVLHIDLLPYGGTLPLLARLFAEHPALHVRNRDLLRRWFWRGTLTGHHRTDNKTDRPRWRAIVTDEHASVQALLKLLPPVTEDSLPGALAPFRRGTARVDVELLAMFALGPRVLSGDDRGAEIAIPSLLGNPDFPWPVAEPAPGAEKTSALFLLHAPIDQRGLHEIDPSDELLSTHAIDPAGFRALLAGDVAEFQQRRASSLLRHLRAFLREQAGIGAADRDRPPLDAYFMDGEA
ncbi:DUF262 domain-containing protein [Sorangium sp. So ce388]|uniref:DUF262 domain-containing protein n=1 Tax=Sorangium sp. So ce388 TaxID=3133309 RepID=UPI003F5C71A2